MKAAQIPNAEAQADDGRRPVTDDQRRAAGTPDAGDLGDRRLTSDVRTTPDGRRPTTDRASSLKPAPRQRPLILVVDDEPDIVFVTKTRIRLNGYDVAEAIDGEIALERIRVLRPDLVLLDLKMPKLDGYQLCKTVKADPNLRSTLILVCSASSSLGLSPEKRCLQIGADGYVRKPYDVRKLLQEISRLLTQRKGFGPVGS